MADFSYSCHARQRHAVALILLCAVMLSAPVIASPTRPTLFSGVAARWLLQQGNGDRNVAQNGGSSSSSSNGGGNGGTQTSADATCGGNSSQPLLGCTYKIRGNETLARLSATLDIDLDTLQIFNLPDDTTEASYFTSRVGKNMQIPCPGTTYRKFFPVQEAGCFFYHLLNTSVHPTLYKLASNPPTNEPGPYTLKGIWTANWQSMGIDLTAPGVFATGLLVYMPTCGHTGKLNPDRLPKPESGTQCGFNPADGGSAVAVRVQRLASDLGTDVGTLQRLNPDKGLQPDTLIIPAGRSTSDDIPGCGRGGNRVNAPVNIPCPDPKVA